MKMWRTEDKRKRPGEPGAGRSLSGTGPWGAGGHEHPDGDASPSGWSVPHFEGCTMLVTTCPDCPTLRGGEQGKHCSAESVALLHTERRTPDP